MTKTKINRTDVHAPSRIDPKAYEFVAFSVREWNYLYDADATGVMMVEATALRRHMDETGGTWADHQHGGSCMICGASAIYLATFYHAATNTYICTGMDCAESMDMQDAARFRRLRDAVKGAQASRHGWAKAEQTLNEKGALGGDARFGDAWDIFIRCQKPSKTTLEGALRRAGAEGDEVAKMALRDLFLDAGLDPDAQPVAWEFEERTICDMVRKLAKFGSLSSKQYDFMASLVSRIENRGAAAAKKAEMLAARAAEKAAAADVPAGRHSLLVEVLKVEEKEYGDGYRATTRLVMTVKAVVGQFVLWGTCPAACADAKKGDVIDLTATLDPSEKDPKFGYIKRPSGKLIKKEGAA